MSKSKSHRDDEDLKGLIREKDKLIKSLRKHIKKLEKERHSWEKTKLDDEVDEMMEPRTHNAFVVNCHSCKRGELKTTDLGIKMLTSCSTCGYRKIAAK